MKRIVFGALCAAYLLQLTGCVVTMTQQPQVFVPVVVQRPVVAVPTIVSPVGYVLTDQPSALEVGALARITLGDELRGYVDLSDQRTVVAIAYQGLLVDYGRHHEQRWSRGDHHYHSRFEPGVYYEEHGRQCRPFTQVTSVRGRDGRVIGQTTRRGIACLEHNGRWVVRG